MTGNGIVIQDRTRADALDAVHPAACDDVVMDFWITTVIQEDARIRIIDVAVRYCAVRAGVELDSAPGTRWSAAVKGDSLRRCAHSIQGTVDYHRNARRELQSSAWTY